MTCPRSPSKSKREPQFRPWPVRFLSLCSSSRQLVSVPALDLWGPRQVHAPGPLWVASQGSPVSWDAEPAAHLGIPRLGLSWWSGCAYANPHASPSPLTSWESHALGQVFLPRTR